MKPGLAPFILLVCCSSGCAAGKEYSLRQSLVSDAPDARSKFLAEMQDRYDWLAALIIKQDLDGVTQFYAADPVVQSVIRPHLAKFFENNQRKRRTIQRLTYTVKCAANRPGYVAVDYVQREKDVWTDATGPHSQDYIEQEQGKWVLRDGRWVTIDTKATGPDYVSYDGAASRVEPNGIPVTSDLACRH